jgi:hypothetical protein
MDFQLHGLIVSEHVQLLWKQLKEESCAERIPVFSLIASVTHNNRAFLGHMINRQLHVSEYNIIALVSG